LSSLKPARPEETASSGRFWFQPLADGCQPSAVTALRAPAFVASAFNS